MKWFVLLMTLAATLVAAEPRPTVSAEIPWGNGDRYVPVVVRVLSPLDGRFRVTAEMGQASATVEADVVAGVARTLTVLLPATAAEAPDAIVSWVGPGDTRDQITARCLARRWRAIAIVDRDETLPLKRFDFVGLSWGTGGSGSDFVGRVPLESLPQRWQGYPAALTLLFSPSDDRRLDDERRGAIATWVATGGAVAVAEPAQIPAWRALGVEPIVLDDVNGDVSLRECVDARDGMSHEPPALVPVPGTERVPATGFALVAVLFAVVVGPLNLWWVRKRGNRHLLLLTTPALSLATCASLLVVNLLIEGVALRRSVLQVTLLDQQRATAVAWTRATYYGGFAVNNLALDAEGCAHSFAPGRENYRRGRLQMVESLAIDWRDGQRLTGWIPARTNRQLLFTVPRPERARLTVERVGTGWQVTNGLGVTIERLCWRDAKMNLWQSDEIAFGATGALTGLPTGHMETPALDLDASGQRAVGTVSTQFAFLAKLAAPFGALPGPVGSDATPPECFVIGSAVPAGAKP